MRTRAMPSMRAGSTRGTQAQRLVDLSGSDGTRTFLLMSRLLVARPFGRNGLVLSFFMSLPITRRFFQHSVFDLSLLTTSVAGAPGLIRLYTSLRPAQLRVTTTPSGRPAGDNCPPLTNSMWSMILSSTHGGLGT